MIPSESFMQFKELNDLNVINLFTKKPFNFNYYKINKEDINKQYSILEGKINYRFKKIIKPKQSHTNIVKKVDELNKDDTFEDVDGLITDLKGIALVTTFADCQGILLYDTDKKVIGNIHSGWKGTLGRIIVNAIKLMINEYNSNPKDIKVFFSPSILQCCFEVDEDVKDLFVNNFNDIDIQKYIVNGNIIDNKQKYYIDTIGINIELLKNIGILENNIYKSNICTMCSGDIFHSHRKNKELDGRNIILIALK